MILEKTVKLIKQIYKYHKIFPPRVSKVVIGLGYTGVEIEAYCYAPFLGLASTLSSVIKSVNCNKIDFAGKLTERSLTNLLQWSCKPPGLKKIIGIAVLNALSQHILEIMNPYKKIKEDLIEYLKIEKDTRVTFVGFILPLVKSINERTRLITIVEDVLSVSPPFNKYSVKKDLHQLNDDDLSTDVLFCTGTALINNTLEEILSIFKRKAQKIVVIGPSASMIPDILFDNGVDVVGGMKILDSAATLKVLQQGGGTKTFKHFGEKYNLTIESNSHFNMF